MTAQSTMRVFRIHRRTRAAANFEGSLRYANRWNSAGTPMLYASSHLSLACLEVLVHLLPGQIPPNLVWSSAALPEEALALAYECDLQDETGARRAGDRWAASRVSLATLVPSVVLPVEMNVLINPLHLDFNVLEWTEPAALKWDQRIVALVVGRTML